MPKHTTRREPVPVEDMRRQIEAYAVLSLEELVEFTRSIFPPDAFEDWLLGIRDGQRPT